MSEDFDRFATALDFILKWEGGYSNDPDDPGGRTDRGISEKANPDAWADGKITDDEVQTKYRTWYWEPAGCEALPWPLCLAVFDYAVNSGPKRAIEALPADGTVLERALVLIARRVAFLRSLDRPRYIRGWMNRCAALAAECIRTGG